MDLEIRRQALFGRESDHRLMNDLQLVVTIDDPKLYTKPWVFTTDNFKWIPDQQLEEQLCIPSDMLQYMKIIGQAPNQ